MPDTQTIVQGRARLTVKPEHAAAVLAELAKCTGKPRKARLTAGKGRQFPKFGAALSTADYVRDYFAANRDVFTGSWDGDSVGYGRKCQQLFEPLSLAITEPVGYDSEVAA